MSGPRCSVRDSAYLTTYLRIMLTVADDNTRQ